MGWPLLLCGLCLKLHDNDVNVSRDVGNADSDLIVSRNVSNASKLYA